MISVQEASGRRIVGVVVLDVDSEIGWDTGRQLRSVWSRDWSEVLRLDMDHVLILLFAPGVKEEAA